MASHIARGNIKVPHQMQESASTPVLCENLFCIDEFKKERGVIRSMPIVKEGPSSYMCWK